MMMIMARGRIAGCRQGIVMGTAVKPKRVRAAAGEEQQYAERA
jgi:hypothetical protein